MKIWKKIKKSHAPLVILILLFYTGKMPINNFFYTHSKMSPENIMPKNSQINSQIETHASTEIVIQKNIKVPENLMLNNFAPESLSQESTTPESIIEKTRNTITIELKQSTKELVQMLENTIANGGGKLKILKGLKCQHQSKKKINETTNQLEKLINETVAKLETKNNKKNLLIKAKTGKFVEKTKKRVFDMHKNMVAQMIGSIGKDPEIVKNNTCKTKKQIAEFEGKIITKIYKFSDKLKQDIKSEII